MKRNEGFSLVELIVVIAILAVLSTAAIVGIGMMSGWRMNKCVRLLDGGLKETRTDALSREAAYLTISCDESGNYYMEGTRHPREKMAGSPIAIVYTTDAQTGEEAITAGHPLTLSYDRASGAFLPILEWDAESGTYVPKQTGEGADSVSVYCTSIQIRAGEEKSTTIRLVKSTGKHIIE